MLHAIPLPQCHLLAKIDGEIVGSLGFTGPIGNLLALCESLPIVKFEPFGELNLEIELSGLSTDKLYLHETCCSVSGGVVPESLANKQP